MPSIKHNYLSLILIIILLSTGCNFIQNQSETQAISSTPSNTEAIINETYPDVVYNVRFLLGQQLQVSPEEISIQSVESVTWPNSCLGNKIEGTTCDPTPLAGYRITLDVLGDVYVYHTDLDNQIHLASTSKKFTDDVVIEWINNDGVCSASKIGVEQISFGECGASMITAAFSKNTGSQELLNFKETYESFTAETPAGNIKFKGKGQKTASSAEQRMIAEWTKMIAMIAFAGRSGAAWGNVITWRRNDCDHLAVFAMGYALGGSCQDVAEQEPSRYYLSPHQLELLYIWYDQFEPFEDTSDGNYLLFSGQGLAITSDIDHQEIWDYSESIFNQIKSEAQPSP